MEHINNSISVLNQDLKKFDKCRDNVVSFVKFFVSLNLQARIAGLKPYYRGTMFIAHLNNIYTYPKEIKKNIFSILFFAGWIIDLAKGSKL